jgi:hypothetical protein
MTHAERLAEFVARACHKDLSDAAVREMKIRVLDALGCAIGALGGDPVRLVREQIEEFDGEPPGHPDRWVQGRSRPRSPRGGASGAMPPLRGRAGAPQQLQPHHPGRLRRGRRSHEGSIARRLEDHERRRHKRYRQQRYQGHPHRLALLALEVAGLPEHRLCGYPRGLPGDARDNRPRILTYKG